MTNQYNDINNGKNKNINNGNNNSNNYSKYSNLNSQQNQHQQHQHSQTIVLPQIHLNIFRNIQSHNLSSQKFPSPQHQQQQQQQQQRQQQQQQQHQQHQQHQQQFDQFTSINNNVLTVKPLRKRAFSKRSKTGCLTCRERRIKCDETKSICKNCHKSKRICKYPKIENTKLTENNNKQVKKVCKVKTTTKKTKKSIDFKNSDSNKSLISEISYSNLHIDDNNSPILQLPRDQNHIPYILNYNPVIVPRQQINNSLDKRYILPPVNSVNNETNSQQLQILPQSYEQQQPLLPPLPMPRKSSSSIYTYDNNLRNGINTSSISSVSTGVGNSRNSMSGSNSSSLVSNDLSNQYFYLLKYRNPGIQSINVNNNNHHYNNNNNNNNNSDISLSLPRQQSHLPLLKNSDPNNYYQQPLVYFNFLDNINNGINGLSVTNAFTENINTTNKTINNNTTTTATIRNNKYNNINHNIDNTNPK